MLIASVTVAAMFTMVEMVVIMQVLVLMCFKLMVGQSTCSTTTEIKGLGMAIGRL